VREKKKKRGGGEGEEVRLIRDLARTKSEISSSTFGLSQSNASSAPAMLSLALSLTLIVIFTQALSLVGKTRVTDFVSKKRRSRIARADRVFLAVLALPLHMALAALPPAPRAQKDDPRDA
jgi:hypothetical protein